MAKLLRVHLVGVGHPEARFHPLTLRFDHEGHPLNTVINLRNGGGKTTLLSLIYAVLLPSKIDFLGKVNESNRSLEMYFTPGKLGIILLEMESRGTEFALMLAWVRRDREDPPTLFSFRTGKGGISFDELPLQGISASPITTLAELITWLNQRHSRAPASVDLFSTTKFREWHGHLKTQRGIDPHLYRAHLQMNKAEGAVDEEFKFTKTNDFIKRYLDFAVEPPSMGREMDDPVTASLNEHRLSLMKQPHYRKEIDFIDEIVPHLQQMASHSQRRRQADTERNTGFAELQQLANGIAHLESEYRNLHATLQSQLNAKKEERDDAVQKRDNAKRHSTGYERRAKILKLAEARRAYTASSNQAEKAFVRLKLLRAALSWRQARRAKAALDALIEEQMLLQHKLRPDFEKVQERALRLNAAYDDAIDVLQLVIDEARKAEANLKIKITEESIKLETLRTDFTRLSNRLSTITGQIELANAARKRLLAEGVIEARDDVFEVEKQLVVSIGKEATTSAYLKSEALRFRNIAKEHGLEATRQGKMASDAENKANDAKRTLEMFNEAKEACAQLPEVKEVLEGGILDPFNPGVVESLNGRERSWRDQWSRLNIERAEDQRLLNQYDPEVHPLFPAPREIEDLLARLHQKGVKGVFTAYEWINANTGTDKTKAHDLIRKNPAKFSGLIVNTVEDLESIKATFSTFPLSRPVQVTLSVDLAKNGDGEGVTIIPERAGLFNAQAAVVEREVIHEYQKELEGRAQDFETNASGFHTAADRVQQLQRDFSALRIEQLTRLTDENTKLSQEHRAAEQNENSAAENAQVQGEDAENQATEHSQTVANFRAKLAKVQGFQSSFGNRLEEWLRSEKVLGTEMAQNNVRQAEVQSAIRQLENRRPSLEDQRTNAGNQLSTLNANKAHTNLGKYLPQNPTRTDHSDVVTEEKPFMLARDVYEDKAKDGGALEGQIQIATEALNEAQGISNRDSHGLAAEEIYRHSEAPDLEIQISKADSDRIDAEALKRTLEYDLQKATQDQPKPLGSNEREDRDPEWPEPETAAEALQMKEEKDQLAFQINEQVDKFRDDVVELEKKSTAAENTAKQYVIMAGTTAPAHPKEPQENPLLTGNPDSDRPQVTAVKSRFDSAKNTVEQLTSKMAQIFDDCIDPLVKHEKWERFELPIQGRFRKLIRNDYETSSAQFTQDCFERRAGLDGKLKEIDAIRETLISQLYNRAMGAVSSLKYAERLSKMPEGAGAWSNENFLRVRIPTLATQAERHVLLGKLMDSWMTVQKKDMAIPQGAALSYECLVAVLGQREIEIEILKPSSDISIRNYQPVTALASFSGGQRVTAAILLYCVIVRVRSDHGDVLTDCGFLMLDNPFGKANHFPLVDLQLKMANLMGVQLIFLTGINDLEALASFPHRIRLRNSTRNAINGERLVQHDSTPIEATRIGSIPHNANPVDH